MDTVIDTVMTRLVATGHPTVGSVYDRITAKCRDISLPEIDAVTISARRTINNRDVLLISRLFKSRPPACKLDKTAGR